MRDEERHVPSSRKLLVPFGGEADSRQLLACFWRPRDSGGFDLQNSGRSSVDCCGYVVVFSLIAGRHIYPDIWAMAPAGLGAHHPFIWRGFPCQSPSTIKSSGKKHGRGNSVLVFLEMAKSVGHPVSR